MPKKEMIDDATIQQTIDAVDASLQTVKEVSKKVTKAELKLQRQMMLNRLPAEVKWESDFMGEVWIGSESREFWVTEPYTNPIVNVATSNGTVIMSNWLSTVENPFMRAAVRAFHDLIAERGEPTLIENRLITLTGLMVSNKKRADWYAQSAEALVLMDGKKMELEPCWIDAAKDKSILDLDLSEGTAYAQAQLFARKYAEFYQYVEGFALANNRLFYHAWLQDKNGKAVDVYNSDQLFGIVFDIDWVEKVIASRLNNETISGCYRYSIIEGNFLDDFKLLKSGIDINW